MKKNICMSAMMVVALLVLPLFSVTALATSVDTIEETVVAEDVITVDENSIESEDEDIPVTGGYDPDTSADTTSNPFTTSGTGTVIDTATDADGKQFYTITTPDEHVFYLIIDNQRSTENVYFLNTVTVADLMALAEFPEESQNVASTTEVPTATTEPIVDDSPVVAEQAEDNNTGMYIIITILVVIGGGAGWYFKIYRPKQQGTAGGDEYEPPAYDDDNDYLDDWDDEQDGDDGNPPWDEDESENDK